MDRNDIFYIGQKAYRPTAERKGSCAGCAGNYSKNESCLIVKAYDELNVQQAFRKYPCSPRGNDNIMRKCFKATEIT